MAHGSFTYGGTVHDGRVNPIDLAEILENPTVNKTKDNVTPIDGFALKQNYPNPFNNSTTIHYQLYKTNIVSLDIYNVLGQKVRTLINDLQQTGEYHITWDGRDDKDFELPSGEYIIQMKSGDISRICKIVMQK